MAVEIGLLMAYEVTRDMPMHEVEIETPLETMRSKLIDGKKLVFVRSCAPGPGCSTDS
jgi:uracil phosphoribosyltransferase